MEARSAPKINNVLIEDLVEAKSAPKINNVLKEDLVEARSPSKIFFLSAPPPLPPTP